MIVGNNPILLNVTYIRPSPAQKQSKDRGECFEVTYKSDDGEVRRSQEPADVDVYFTKPECRDFNYNKPEERIEHLVKHRVRYNDIRKTIGNEIGEEGVAFIRRCYENRDTKSLDKLYAWPHSFRADFQPEFYFMDDWLKKYPLPSSFKLTKAFLDVEVDQRDGFVDMDNIPNSATCPVNCVTVILEESKECCTFILKPRPPSKVGHSPEEFEKLTQYYETQLRDHTSLMANLDGFKKDLAKSFEPVYGTFRYHLRDYDKEIDLIADVFRLINDRKPNFCLEWNMRFDIQYLLYRISTLGYNPADVMCNNDFERKQCYFRVDRNTFQLEKQFDYFYCSSYTHYICQMRLYASIRKSQHALKSVSLNYIGNRELRDRKVEYENEMNFTELTYLHWPMFLKYNIKDVLLQVGIERITNDVMTYYLRSITNCTPYNKIFRETHLLRNVRELYFNKAGWVQGNNINIIGRGEEDTYTKSDSDEEDEDSDKGPESTFKGAIMAEPTMNARVGMPVLGTPSNAVFVNLMDFDMESFYPGIKILSNMDPITLIGKAILNNNEFTEGDMINRSMNQTYQELDKLGNLRMVDNTGEAVNTFLTGNTLTFGYNWLGLPDIADLYKTVMRNVKKDG